MTAEQLATTIGSLLNQEGFAGAEQIVHDSDDPRQLYIQVLGEWFTVQVRKDAL